MEPSCTSLQLLFAMKLFAFSVFHVDVIHVVCSTCAGIQHVLVIAFTSVCLCAVAGIQQRMQKKDEKLEKLKACLDVFETVEEIQAECNWDEMMTEVLQTIAQPD